MQNTAKRGWNHGIGMKAKNSFSVSQAIILKHIERFEKGYNSISFSTYNWVIPLSIMVKFINAAAFDVIFWCLKILKNPFFLTIIYYR